MAAKPARWKEVNIKRKKHATSGVIKIPVESMEEECSQNDDHRDEHPDGAGSIYAEVTPTPVMQPVEKLSPISGTYTQGKDTHTAIEPMQDETLQPQPVTGTIQQDLELSELRDKLSRREDELSRCKSELEQYKDELTQCREQLDSVSDYVMHLQERDCSIQDEQRIQIESCLKENDKQYRSFRERMSEEANAWQRDIYGRVSELTQKIDALNNLGNGLQQTVQSWRKEMFAGKFERLGYCYRNLCSLLNRIDANNAQRVSRNEEVFPEGEQLRIWKNGFERSLTDLGLEIVSPHAGDEFDPDLHILAPESEKEGINPYEEGLRVCGCVAPGIGYCSDDLFFIVVQPIVTVERP